MTESILIRLGLLLLAALLLCKLLYELRRFTQDSYRDTFEVLAYKYRLNPKNYVVSPKYGQRVVLIEGKHGSIALSTKHFLALVESDTVNEEIQIRLRIIACDWGKQQLYANFFNTDLLYTSTD